MKRILMIGMILSLILLSGCISENDKICKAYWEVNTNVSSVGSAFEYKGTCFLDYPKRSMDTNVKQSVAIGWYEENKAGERT